MRISPWVATGLFCLGSCASAQVMLEHGLATSLGSTLSNGAGKKTGEGVGSILNKAAGTLDSASRDSSVPAPAQTKTTRTAAIAQPTSKSAEPAKSSASDKQFSEIAAGMSRAAVLEKLGPPTSKLTIPEDGKLIEVYRFAGTAGELGSVRFVDGTVETVKKN